MQGRGGSEGDKQAGMGKIQKSKYIKMYKFKEKMKQKCAYHFIVTSMETARSLQAGEVGASLGKAQTINDDIS